METVAFFGLGNMGEPMVANLLAKGFAVHIVQHRRPDAVERLRGAGAKVFPDAAAAAQGVKLVILALPGSAESEALLTGPGGLIEALPHGAVVVDCSTGEPPVTRRQAKLLSGKGIGLVDAGLTRGVAGAKQGKLAYFMGGTEADMAKAKPALDAMGDTFFHMGPVGSGHEAKNLSNALSYATVALACETLILGRSLGLDPARLQEALMAGAGSKALEAYGPRIVSGDYAPVRVSIGNACAHLQTTEHIVPEGLGLKLLPQALQSYRRADGQGLGGQDISAIAELWPRS
ncbi:NAD(P)-dependent oxidoreductase [Arvimicrobium flavum]|uniref:NAD(P)-dependent oxidoreductase n=1 Tax=Arvimicrobium flavum TaxID=3393320 RepID=UPI00237A97C7|nr:NAD(P)-dependent oxidoreductase [Mesorhizobium shangrilense]